MATEFDSGLLLKAHAIGDGYYFLVEGTAPHDGKKYGFVTRGKGRQNAATRIPIRIKFRNQEDSKMVVRAVIDGAGMFDVMKKLYQKGYGFSDFELVYVVMPRYGNLISGREINAPGGTAEVGETREHVARREFEEEAEGLTVLATHNPSGMLWSQTASGCYDEVQLVDIALVVGKTTKLVEGANRFGLVSLHDFPQWLVRQNNPQFPIGWETRIFEPVDGKVAMNVLLFIEQMKTRVFGPDGG